jgi:histidinol-phosphate aminotransferase
VLTPLARLGIALAQPPLIQILANTKAPYNISTPTAALARAALSPESVADMHTKVATLAAERTKLLRALAEPPLRALGVGAPIGASHANFVRVPIHAREAADRDVDGAAVDGTGARAPDNLRAQAAYIALAEAEGVVVRFRGTEPGCEGCLRITVGAPEENALVVQKLTEVLGRV